MYAQYKYQRQSDAENNVSVQQTAPPSRRHYDVLQNGYSRGTLVSPESAGWRVLPASSARQDAWRGSYSSLPSPDTLEKPRPGVECLKTAGLADSGIYLSPDDSQSRPLVFEDNSSDAAANLGIKIGSLDYLPRQGETPDGLVRVAWESSASEGRIASRGQGTKSAERGKQQAADDLDTSLTIYSFCDGLEEKVSKQLSNIESGSTRNSHSRPLSTQSAPDTIGKAVCAGGQGKGGVGKSFLTELVDWPVVAGSHPSVPGGQPLRAPQLVLSADSHSTTRPGPSPKPAPSVPGGQPLRAPQLVLPADSHSPTRPGSSPKPAASRPPTPSSEQEASERSQIEQYVSRMLEEARLALPQSLTDGQKSLVAATAADNAVNRPDPPETRLHVQNKKKKSKSAGSVVTSSSASGRRVTRRRPTTTGDVATRTGGADSATGRLTASPRRLAIKQAEKSKNNLVEDATSPGVHAGPFPLLASAESGELSRTEGVAGASDGGGAEVSDETASSRRQLTEERTSKQVQLPVIVSVQTAQTDSGRDVNMTSSTPAVSNVSSGRRALRDERMTERAEPPHSTSAVRAEGRASWKSSNHDLRTSPYASGNTIGSGHDVSPRVRQTEQGSLTVSSHTSRPRSRRSSAAESVLKPAPPTRDAPAHSAPARTTSSRDKPPSSVCQPETRQHGQEAPNIDDGAQHRHVNDQKAEIKKTGEASAMSGGVEEDISLGSCTYEDVHSTARYLLAQTVHRPKIGIVCGSGLGGLCDMLEDTNAMAYETIPNFPMSTAPGHAGRLVFGTLSGKTCVCMQGRLHLYEGYPAWKVVFPIRVMQAMGVEVLFVTNAAGGLNPHYNVGDCMILKDHINLPGLAGLNPLLGPNDERFGPRFPALSDAYDKELRGICKQAARDLDFNFVHEGVYVIQTGPCYETVSECRMLRMMGADVTGMSTVPEVIAARHSGMRVFAMSLVTNACVTEFDSEQKANCEEVLETGRIRSQDMQLLVARMVKLIELEPEN